MCFAQRQGGVTARVSPIGDPGPCALTATVGNEGRKVMGDILSMIMMSCSSQSKICYDLDKSEAPLMSRDSVRSRRRRVAGQVTAANEERFTSAARADVSRMICRWAIA